MSVNLLLGSYRLLYFALIMLPLTFWQNTVRAADDCSVNPGGCVNACGRMMQSNGEITGSSMNIPFPPDNLLITAPDEVMQGQVIFSQQVPLPLAFICEAPADKHAATPYLLVNPDQLLHVRDLLARNGIALQFQVNSDGWKPYAAGTAVPLTNKPYSSDPEMQGQVRVAVAAKELELGLRLVRQTTYADQPVAVADGNFTDLKGATLFYIAPSSVISDGQKLALNLQGSLSYRVAHCALKVDFSKPTLNFGMMTAAALENNAVKMPFDMTVSKVSACNGHANYATDFPLYRLSVTFTSADSTVSNGSMLLRANDESQSDLNLQLSIMNTDNKKLAFGVDYAGLGYASPGTPVMDAASQQKTVHYIAEINRQNSSLPVKTGEFRSIIVATINYY